MIYNRGRAARPFPFVAAITAPVMGLSKGTPMFKDREIRIKLNKTNESESQDSSETIKDFDERADSVMHRVERLMVGMFVGIGIYVLLDTGRQVAVAKANKP